MKAEPISENPLDMRWVEDNFIKVDYNRSIVLVVCDYIDETPYVGFVWISRTSPTNMMDHLASFVWKTRYRRERKIGLLSKLIEFINSRRKPVISFDDIKWFDIQKPYYKREDGGHGPNYFSYKSVSFEDGRAEWGSRKIFSELPEKFQRKIEEELVVAAKIMGVGE